ncbi:hypothetical protein [Neptuniibacter pectenicola]|uniref:hypothetical protein n=1 Tax=Neptuniibacter pectenicola TaxID=1806669 RepID=UPI000832BEC5|nr:hypothetical protein [Neptuniibacter pectenicola]
MALDDLSFKLYQDSALTTPYGGTLTITHNSDLSDGAQDFILYFGSASTSVQLQSNVNPGVDNIVVTPVDNLPEWEASTAQVVGYSAEPTVGNGRRYQVTTAGTSDATEPTWPTSIGSSVTDGTIIWTCVSSTHETTEVKLAATALDLDTATAGAGLSLGTTVLSGVANAKEIHVRVTNTVEDISNANDIALSFNNVLETAQ